MRILLSAVLVVAPMASGCSDRARSPDAYRDDTAGLLETTNEAVKSCYANVLERQPGVQGVDV